MNILLLAFEPGALYESQVESVRACVPGLRVAVTKERDEIEALLGEIYVVAGQFRGTCWRRRRVCAGSSSGAPARTGCCATRKRPRLSSCSPAPRAFTPSR
jgi:hypothetical protein